MKIILLLILTFSCSNSKISEPVLEGCYETTETSAFWKSRKYYAKINSFTIYPNNQIINYSYISYLDSGTDSREKKFFNTYYTKRISCNKFKEIKQEITLRKIEEEINKIKGILKNDY